MEKIFAPNSFGEWEFLTADFPVRPAAQSPVAYRRNQKPGPNVFSKSFPPRANDRHFAAADVAPSGRSNRPWDASGRRSLCDRAADPPANIPTKKNAGRSPQRWDRIEPHFWRSVRPRTPASLHTILRWETRPIMSMNGAVLHHICSLRFTRRLRSKLGAPFRNREDLAPY